jgi:hypothetical protein
MDGFELDIQIVIAAPCFNFELKAVQHSGFGIEITPNQHCDLAIAATGRTIAPVLEVAMAPGTYWRRARCAKRLAA